VTISAIIGARILSNGRLHDNCAVIVDGDTIHSVVGADDIPAAADIIRLNGGMLLPGFVDTQVNGGGGVLFNDQTNVSGIAAIARAHRAFGTTAMLPTLISDDFAVIAAAINAVDAAIVSGVPGIIGIHIEGPFLNAGKRGIHDARKFRTLDAGAVDMLSSLKHGKTVVTLAPELAPEGMIRALTAKGVIVSAGHTLADYDDMQRAIGEGLSGVTHLFNAMTMLNSRSPGVVGAAFDSKVFCGIIADGHHVHPATLRAAYRIKTHRELMLVTDAMPTVGTAMKNFNIGETAISLKHDMLQSEDGTLAGSNLHMIGAVRNAMQMLSAELPEVSQMASTTPAAFLGLSGSIGEIATGHRADLVHVSDSMNVEATWIAGLRG
jgi:N-acetylglucosamine-6-phosphate deacetylase